MTMTMQQVAESIRYVDDFPIEGIRFFDIESVVENPEASKAVMDAFYNRYKDVEIDYVAGFDARGFLFGFALAQMLGVGFKQIRKPGKLPGTTVSAEYMKEYGPDTIHMEQTDLLSGARVLLIDDLLATGGTAAAGVALIEKLGGIVVEFACVIELPELGGRCAHSELHNGNMIQTPVCSLITISNNKAVVTGEQVRYCIDPLIIDETSGQLLLVERLNEPKGLAMAGGGIEDGESVLDAVMREIAEEVGLIADTDKIEFYSVLTGADRDPRGDQVSYVCTVTCNTEHAIGEVDKTEPVSMGVYEVGMAKVQSTFAFADHAETVYGYYRDKFPSESVPAD